MKAPKGAFDGILERFAEKQAKTLKLWKGYEALRPEYHKAFKNLSRGR